MCTPFSKVLSYIFISVIHKGTHTHALVVTFPMCFLWVAVKNTWKPVLENGFKSWKYNVKRCWKIIDFRVSVTFLKRCTEKLQLSWVDSDSSVYHAHHSKMSLCLYYLTSKIPQWIKELEKTLKVVAQKMVFLQILYFKNSYKTLF